MAIIKTIETPYGVPANYHRIKKVEINTDLNEIIIDLELYTTETAKKNGLKPLSTEQIKIPFYRLEKDPRIPFYNALQELDWSSLLGGIPDIVPDTSFSFGIKPLVSPPLPIYTAPPPVEQPLAPISLSETYSTESPIQE